MTEPTRIALVTGASRGLGLVIARVLGSRGYGLVIGGRDRDALAAAAAGLSRHAPAVLPVAGDITDAAVRASLIDAARRLGGLDVLVNNASELGGVGPLLTFDVPRFGRLFPVNVGAPMVLTQLAVPLLAERRGLVVNITSDAATAAYPGWGPYGATKAALELLTRTLANELRERGVSAVLVDPGDMRTRMTRRPFRTKTSPIVRCRRSRSPSGTGCSIRSRTTSAANASPPSRRMRGGFSRRDRRRAAAGASRGGGAARGARPEA